MPRPPLWGGITACGALLIASALAGCGGDGDDLIGSPPPPPAPPPDPVARWEPLGEVPAPKTAGIGSQSPMAQVGEDVLVGTADGVWRRPLAGGAWTRSGLEGFSLAFVEAHPTDPARVFAGGLPADASTVPFFYSSDGGVSWTAAATSAFDQLAGAYYAFYDLVVSTQNPSLLFANMSGSTVNVSFDGGATWLLANGATEPDFGTHCHLALPATAQVRLYQGCEAPLDVATLARYPVNLADPVDLGNGETLVASDALGNRRPNILKAAAADPSLLFVGVEGALLAYDIPTDSASFPFRAEDEDAPEAFYTYVRGIWSDPQDAATVLFGGAENGKDDATLELYLTEDGGETVDLVAGPQTGLPAIPVVEQLLAEVRNGDAEEQSILVLVSQNQDGLFLFRYVLPGESR